jgi:hypothetical protein
METIANRLDYWEKCIDGDHIFNCMGITTKIDYDTHDMSINVVGYSNKHKCFDVYLFLEHNEMAIAHIQSCPPKLCGTDILEYLYSVAYVLGIETVELMDTSTIHDGKVHLGYYHILLHGISWYNSMGYYGKSFKEDTLYNKRQIQRPIDNVVECPNMRAIMEDVLGDYDVSMTVQQAIRELDWVMRRNIMQLELYILFEYLIRQLRLRYNPMLKMRVSSTEKIYIQIASGKRIHPPRL